MVKAFALLGTSAGTSESVVEAARRLDGVTEAHVVTGEFDVLVEVEGEAVRDVMGTVTREVRTLPGAGTTRTYLVLE